MGAPSRATVSRPATTLSFLLASTLVLTVPALADEAQDDDSGDLISAEEDASDATQPLATSSSTAPKTALELRRPREAADGRTLRFHTFRDPVVGTSALNAGSFAFRPGLVIAQARGFEDEDGPVYDLGLGGGALDLALAFQLHERAGLRLHGEGLVAVGTNTATLENTGGRGVADVDADLVFVLLRREQGGVQLSGLVGGQGRFGLALDPSPATPAVDPVTGESLPTSIPDPLTRTTEWGAGGGLALAYAFQRHVAMQVSAEAHGGATTTRNDGDREQDPLLVAQGALTLDLDAWPHVPIALQIAYGYEHRFQWFDANSVQSRGAHEIGGGIFFSGNPKTTVGLTASGRFGRADDPYARLARIDVVLQRYF